MQTYKYCQCKNGTQRINAAPNHNDDTNDDRYTYIVDCNRKQVYQANSGKDKDNSGEDAHPPPENDDGDKTAIWTIFGSSAANPSRQSYVCMFASSILVILSMTFVL